MSSVKNQDLFRNFLAKPKTSIERSSTMNGNARMRNSIITDDSSEDDIQVSENPFQNGNKQEKPFQNGCRNIINSDIDEDDVENKGNAADAVNTRKNLSGVGNRNLILSSDDEDNPPPPPPSKNEAMGEEITIIDDSDSDDSQRPKKKRRVRLGKRRVDKKKEDTKKKTKVMKVRKRQQNEDEDSEANFSDSDLSAYGEKNDVDEVAVLFEKCEDISSRIKTKLESVKATAKQPSSDGGDPASASTDSDFVIKPDFAKTLFPGDLDLKNYQVVGLNWMNILYNESVNGILADEMGLGKTVQAMALFALLDKRYGIKGPHLVVAPGSTLENWRRELNKWLPDHAVAVYHGSQEERHKIRRRIRSQIYSIDVILTTYTYFERASSADDRKFFYKQHFAYVVYDEAHAIKNMKSSRYQRLIKITCDRRLLLSGTPVQNNLNELLALMSFCMPKVFKAGDEQLVDYFASEKAKKQLKRIRKALTPFILRRVKADVLTSLSQKIEDVRMVKLIEGTQEKLYNEIIAEYKQRKLTGDGIEGGDAQNVFMKLRKASNHPLLVRNYFGRTVDGVDRDMKKLVKILTDVHAFGPAASESMIEKETANYSDWQLHLLCCQYGRMSSLLTSMRLPMEALWASAKCVELRDLLPKLKSEGHRMCLFSQWTTILDILEELMKAINLNYVRFDGQTAIADRQTLVDKFNTDKNIDVFLLSTRAGGLGINLTSADTVVIHDLDFNPTVDRQAEDRCHRIGQTKPVTVIKLVCEDTVDQGILEMQRRKTALDQDLFLNKPKNASKSDADFILKILNSL